MKKYRLFKEFVKEKKKSFNINEWSVFFLKMKKLLTVFMAGVMAFITTAYSEIGSKLSGYQAVKPIKEHLHVVWSMVSITSENVMLQLKYLVLNHDLAWGNERQAQLNLEDKMLPELNKSQSICRQSGILLEANQVAIEAILNGKVYRGSG